MVKLITRRLAPVWPITFCGILGAALVFAGPALAGIYVDNTLGNVAPADIVHIANPRPVQLLFEFDTAERINARATKLTTPIVKGELQKLGIVGPISDIPVPDGARLVITVDNIVDKNVANKGLAVGLTLGLVGTVVADNYIFVIRYTPASGAQAIERIVHHRIYTKFGLGASAPSNATKAENTMAAFTTVVHQALAHGLNEIAADPGFATAATIPAAVPISSAPAAQSTPESVSPATLVTHP